MSESLLIKEFRGRDVSRLRNIVTAKYGDKTGIQVGYQNQYVEHKEGDIWEENGKEWTIKDGLKQSYTKLDKVKEMLRMPLGCPKCKGSMNSRLDKKMYPIHGFCFNCVIEMESELRREGKYEEYSRNKINGNLYSFIEDAEQFIKEYSNGKDQSYVTENGEIEDWEGKSKRSETVTKWLSELEEMKNNLIT